MELIKFAPLSSLKKAKKKKDKESTYTMGRRRPARSWFPTGFVVLQLTSSYSDRIIVTFSRR